MHSTLFIDVKIFPVIRSNFENFDFFLFLDRDSTTIKISKKSSTKLPSGAKNVGSISSFLLKRVFAEKQKTKTHPCKINSFLAALGI